MKKSIRDIYLVSKPVFQSSNSKKSPDCGHFGNRSKSLLIIHTKLLPTTENHQPGFESVNGAIGQKLGLVQPLAPYGSLPWRNGSEGPSAIGLKSTELQIHGSTPLGVLHGLSKRPRIMTVIQGSKKTSMGSRQRNRTGARSQGVSRTTGHLGKGSSGYKIPEPGRRLGGPSTPSQRWRRRYRGWGRG